MTRTHPKIGKSVASVIQRPHRWRFLWAQKQLFVSALVGLGFFLVTLSLWQGVKLNEREEIQRQVGLASASFQVELQEQMQERILALVQVAKRWEVSGQPQQQDWEIDVNFIIDRIGGYEAIAWVDASGQINWVVPALDAKATQNLTNLVLKPWQPMGIESAQQQQDLILTQSVHLTKGKRGFLVYARLMHQGQFDGFLVGVFDTQKLFDNLIQFLKLYEISIFEGPQESYDIEIFEGQEKIYDRDVSQVTSKSQWMDERTLELNDVTWRLQIAPKSETIADDQPDVAAAILAAGTLMSILLAGMVYLFQTAQRRAQQLERSNHRLTEEIDERQQAEQALLESRTRLKLLNSLSNRITAGMSVEQVIELTLEQMHEHFPRFRVLYAMIDHKNCLTIHYERKPADMIELQGIAEDLNTSPEYRNALRSKQPVIVDDIALDPRTATSIAPILIPYGTRSILDVPLQLSHQQLVGVLCFDGADPHHWSQHEISSITEVAEYLTIAIQEAEAQAKQQAAELALQNSEARYRSMTDDVIDTSAVGILILDADLNIIWINQTLETLLNLDREAVIGQNQRQLIHQQTKRLFDDPEFFESQLLAAYGKKDAIATFECYIPPLGDRPEHWLEYWSRPIHSGLYEGGRIEHFTDITERKRAEIALQERQTRLRLLKNIATGITTGMSVEQVIQSTLEQISQAFTGLRVIYGTINPHNQFIISHEISPLDMPPLKGVEEDLNLAPEYLKLLRNKEVVQIEDARQDSRLGPLAPVIISNNTLAILDVPLQHSQQLVGLLGLDAPKTYHWSSNEIETMTEVAEYLTVAIQEAETRQTRKKLEDELDRIFNLSLDMLCVTSVDGHFTRINPAFERTLGYHIEELLAQPLLDFVHPNDQEATVAELTKLSRGIPMVDFENRYRCQDGSYKWLAWSSVPVLSDGLAYTVARDITERKKVEQMKDEFVAVTSHELRTPLTSLRASLCLIATGQLGTFNEQGKQLLDFALTDAELLVRLVNDILDHQRLKFNKKPLDLKLCQVLPILEQVKIMTQSAAEQAQIYLHVSTTDVCVIWAEPDRVVQVLTNLINNAMKFSPPHSTITIHAVPQEQHVLFTVKDQGCGIAEEHLETIFEPFRTLDGSDSRSAGGTGLGLAICRSIVQAHKGAIWVESLIGKGTTFSFTLPQPSPTTQSDVPPMIETVV